MDQCFRGMVFAGKCIGVVFLILIPFALCCFCTFTNLELTKTRTLQSGNRKKLNLIQVLSLSANGHKSNLSECLSIAWEFKRALQSNLLYSLVWCLITASVLKLFNFYSTPLGIFSQNTLCSKNHLLSSVAKLESHETKSLKFLQSDEHLLS